MTKLSIIIFLAYFTAVSASRAKHKRNEALEANIGEAFLVNAAGCSGAFISKNWILTAAHCYDWVLNYANSEPAVEGDYVYEVPDDEIEIIIKAKAARLVKNLFDALLRKRLFIMTLYEIDYQRKTHGPATLDSQKLAENHTSITSVKSLYSENIRMKL